MKKEIISQAVGEIAPRYVSEALRPAAAADSGAGNGFLRFWKTHRAAACLCSALLLSAVTFSTAFAANASFRRTVVSFFYPNYSGNEIRQIDEGHRTGSFDVEDTLFSFLDEFNGKKMVTGLTAEKRNGYEYTLLSGRSGTVEAIVECSRSNSKLLVTMQRKPYRGTTGLWQVVSYQVIDSETAKKMQSELQPYVSGSAVSKQAGN